MKRVILVYGNCQAGVFEDALKWFPALREHYETRYCASFDEQTPSRSPPSVDDMVRCELVLEQLDAGKPLPESLASAIPASAQRIRFPPLDVNLLWPLNFPDPRNKPDLPQFPFGEFPYGDRAMIELLRRGVTADAALSAYPEESARRIPDLDRLKALEERRLAQRDQNVDVPLSDLVLGNLAIRPLFWTINHPTGWLLGRAFERITQQIWTVLGLPDDPVPTLRAHFANYDPLGSHHVPIHPLVAERLRLTWWSPERTYRHLDGTMLTQAEYLDRYVRFAPFPVSKPAAAPAGPQFSPDEACLVELSRFCLEESPAIRADLPATREGQARLAHFLEGRLRGAGRSFRLSKDYLRDTVRLQDGDLLAGWTSSPVNLAWLMVHEELADFGLDFVRRVWKPEVVLVHYLPLCGGDALERQMRSEQLPVFRLQNSFDEMAQTTGLLAFAQMLHAFLRPDGDRSRIFYGGSYNLPAMMARFGEGRPCQGVTILHQPVKLLLDGARAVWARLQGGDAMGGAYAAVDQRTLAAVRRAVETRGNQQSLNEMGRHIRAIVAAEAFAEEFADMLPRAYLGSGVSGLGELAQLFQRHPGMAIFNDGCTQASRIGQHLGLVGKFRAAETDSPMQAAVMRSVGGAAGVHRLIGHHALRGSEIYGVLTALAALRGAASGG